MNSHADKNNFFKEGGGVQGILGFARVGSLRSIFVDIYNHGIFINMNF